MKLNTTETIDSKKSKIYRKQRGLSPVVLVFLFGLMIILSTGFLSCSGAGTEYSEVIINVGGGSKDVTWPPDDIVSYTLTVSGSDFGTLQVVYPGGVPAVSMLVPKGSAREIQLEVFKNPLSTSAVLSWQGNTTVDLEEDAEEIALSMELGETKLVIPDADDNNAQSRIVQINDMTGAGWTESNYVQFGFGSISVFQPEDIDFDRKGRIYIVNSYSSTGAVPLIRIDSLADSLTYDVIVSESEVIGLRSLAVDRTNNYVYYTTGSSPIYRKSLGPPLGTQESFDIQTDAGFGNFNTQGIAVDEEGVLYVTNNMENSLTKYDVSYTGSQRVQATYTANLNYPYDVLINGDKVIVANMSGADGYKFVVLDKDFNLIDHFGNYPSDTGNPGDNETYGPGRFVAITNRKITVIDEGNDGLAPVDRLVGLEPDGSDWQTYGSTGSGVGQFYFFSYH